MTKLQFLVSLVVAILGVTQATHLREPSAADPPQRKLATTCNMEIDTNYDGNDLRSVSSRPVDTCCDECAATAGCTAWSWSNYYGGTCWLKSRKGTSSHDPGVVSAEMPVSQSACPLEYNVDYVGYDIANVHGDYAGSCCKICMGFSGCKAFSWTNYNGGTCWLKSNKGTTVKNNQVNSGVVVNGGGTSPSTCLLEKDIDFVGNDIGNARGGCPGACCDICRSRSGCNAFSWSNYNGGTCWLKSKKGTTVSKAGVTSGELGGQDPCPLEYGVNYVDNDIANAPASKPRSCCDICRGWPGCRAFTWSNYNGGTCWLKSARGSKITTAGAISSYIY